VAPADVQILGTGSKAAPLDYVLPSGSELVLKAVRADFNGAGAASAFLPALEIISDAGHSVGVYPTDVAVAAGGSASVSFAPFLRNAAAAATSTSLPSAVIDQLVDPFADTGFNLTAISMNSAHFFTNDATVFDVGASAGTTTIKALVPGVYLVWATVLGDLTVAPVANSYLQVFGFASTSYSPFNQSRFDSWRDIDGFGDYEAGATHAFLTVIRTIDVPPPKFFFLRAGQNSGSNIQLHANLQVVRLSSTTYF